MSASTASDSPAKERSGPDRKPIWIRGAFMLLFLLAFSIAQTLQAFIAVVQFVTLLITGKPNAHLADFGRGLAMWLAESSAFLTCATERRPFPFAPWPRIE